MAERWNPSLAEAVTRFLSTLSPAQRQQNQQELNKFVRWYGAERLVSELAAQEMANYAESVTSPSTDPVPKLEPIRAFLSYAKKESLIRVNLASRLRPSKAKKNRVMKKSGRVIAPVALTREGYTALESELATLKSERPRIIDQLRRAAADKDFRENAPLEAAKDRQGLVEGRIRDLEATLQAATTIQQALTTTKTVGIGSTVILCDLASGEQLSYNLVSPSEANPAQGKLSIASPTGKALLDQTNGTVIEVIAPLGTLRYRIEDIQG